MVWIVVVFCIARSGKHFQALKGVANKGGVCGRGWNGFSVGRHGFCYVVVESYYHREVNGRWEVSRG